MEAQAIFLYLFNVCSLCKWKCVICPFVNKETNGSYMFANGLNGLAYLGISRYEIAPVPDDETMVHPLDCVRCRPAP